MNIRLRGAAVLAAASLSFATAASASWPADAAGRRLRRRPCPASALKRARGLIAEWPAPSRSLAEILVLEYGAPGAALPSQLTWSGKRPWTRISVYRDASPAGRPRGLEQAVAYDVPVRKWRALAAFARGVDYDPVKRELIARTDGEPTNFLSLNLADEVIRGRRTPEEAREFYDRTVYLSFAGKSSPYMTRLRFRPQRLPETLPDAAPAPPAGAEAAVAGGTGMR